MHYPFRIAGVGISLETSEHLTDSPVFKRFYQPCQNPYVVSFRKSDRLEYDRNAPVLCREQICRILPDSGCGFVRIYDDGFDHNNIYAVRTADYANHKITVSYLSSGRKFVNEVSNSFYHAAIEEILLQEDRVILHASLVTTPLGGILFTGPSGMGKSTQAMLWVKYGHARQINGDRTILHREEDGWYGYGSPYAGSSECHINEGVRICAVVVLNQAKSNRVEVLKGRKAFLEIYKGLTINTWNPEFIDRASAIAAELISEVPVYRLSCVPDKTAVDALRNVIERGETI